MLRQLLAARAARSSAISMPALIWARARTSSTSLSASATLDELVAHRRHQLGHLVLAGAGIDAEQAAIGIGRR